MLNIGFWTRTFKTKWHDTAHWPTNQRPNLLCGWKLKIEKALKKKNEERLLLIVFEIYTSIF